MITSPPSCTNGYSIRVRSSTRPRVPWAIRNWRGLMYSHKSPFPVTSLNTKHCTATRSNIRSLWWTWSHWLINHCTPRAPFNHNVHLKYTCTVRNHYAFLTVVVSLPFGSILVSDLVYLGFLWSRWPNTVKYSHSHSHQTHVHHHQGRWKRDSYLLYCGFVKFFLDYMQVIFVEGGTWSRKTR